MMAAHAHAHVLALDAARVGTAAALRIPGWIDGKVA